MTKFALIVMPPMVTSKCPDEVASICVQVTFSSMVTVYAPVCAMSPTPGFVSPAQVPVALQFPLLSATIVAMRAVLVGRDAQGRTVGMLFAVMARDYDDLTVLDARPRQAADCAREHAAPGGGIGKVTISRGYDGLSRFR
jgi:hypothetical protein